MATDSSPRQSRYPEQPEWSRILHDEIVHTPECTYVGPQDENDLDFGECNCYVTRLVDSIVAATEGAHKAERIARDLLAVARRENCCPLCGAVTPACVHINAARAVTR